MGKDIRRVQRSLYAPIWLDEAIDKMAKQRKKSYNDTVCLLLMNAMELKVKEGHA